MYHRSSKVLAATPRHAPVRGAGWQPGGVRRRDEHCPLAAERVLHLQQSRLVADVTDALGAVVEERQTDVLVGHERALLDEATEVLRVDDLTEQLLARLVAATAQEACNGTTVQPHIRFPRLIVSAAYYSSFLNTLVSQTFFVKRCGGFSTPQKLN